MDNFLNKIVTLVKLLKPDLHVKIASLLLFGSIGFLASFNIYIYNDTSGLAYTDNGTIISNALGVLFALIALGILLKRLKIEEAKEKFIFYIPGMEFCDSKFPIKYIPRQSRINLQNLQRGIIDSYSKQEVINSFIYNRQSLKEQVYNKNATTTYIAGLGSFPHLFLSGYLFNSGHQSDVHIFDYNRNKKEWYLLDEFGKTSKYILSNSDETIERKINSLLEQDNDEVGIAIANSFTIEETSIPDELRGHTLFLKPNIGVGLDCCNNKETQASLLEHLTEIMANLSNKKKKIHLFVAARASFCINFGTYYMPHTHSTIILHNYNNKEKERDWNITLDDGELS